MRYLLDTHAIIWIARKEEHWITPRAAAIINDIQGSQVFLSAASAWEMATKNRIGKLPGVELFLEKFEERAEMSDYKLLPISIRHSLLAGKLEGAHKDPFDRILVAQALHENMILLSNDIKLDAFGVNRLW